MIRFWRPFALRLLDVISMGAILGFATHALLQHGWTWPLGILTSVLALVYLCKALYLAAGLAGYVSIRVRVKQRVKGYQNNGRDSHNNKHSQR